MSDEITIALRVARCALRVASAIESVGGTYFVGGSVASSLQGEPRSTNDIDIVVEIPLGRIDALAEALGPDFEVDRAMLRDALLHGRSCNIFYLQPRLGTANAPGVPAPTARELGSRRRFHRRAIQRVAAPHQFRIVASVADTRARAARPERCAGRLEASLARSAVTTSAKRRQRAMWPCDRAPINRRW